MANKFWNDFFEAADNFWYREEQTKKTSEITQEEASSLTDKILNETPEEVVKKVEDAVKKEIGFGRKFIGGAQIIAGFILRFADLDPTDDDDWLDRYGRQLIKLGKTSLGIDTDIAGVSDTFKNDPFQEQDFPWKK